MKKLDSTIGFVTEWKISLKYSKILSTFSNSAVCTVLWRETNMKLIWDVPSICDWIMISIVGGTLGMLLLSTDK